MTIVAEHGFDFKMNPSLKTSAKWDEVANVIKQYVDHKGRPQGVPVSVMKGLLKAMKRHLNKQAQKPIRTSMKEGYVDRPTIEILFYLWMLQLECDEKDRQNPESNRHPYHGRKFEGNLEININGSGSKRVEQFRELVPVTNSENDGFLAFSDFVSLAAAPTPLTVASASGIKDGSHADSTNSLQLIQVLTQVLGKEDKSQSENDDNEETKEEEKESEDNKRKADSNDASAQPNLKKKRGVGRGSKEVSAKNSGSKAKGDQITKYLENKIGVVFPTEKHKKDMIGALVGFIPMDNSGESGMTSRGDEILAQDSVAGVTRDDEGGEECSRKKNDDDSSSSGSSLDVANENDRNEDDSEDDSGEDDDDDDEEDDGSSTIYEMLSLHETGPQMKSKNDSVTMTLADAIEKGHKMTFQCVDEDAKEYITATFEKENDGFDETRLMKYSKKYDIAVTVWSADKNGELKSFKYFNRESPVSMHIFKNQKHQPKHSSAPTVIKGYAVLTTKVRRTNCMQSS